jgi:ribosomal protein S18 acetylase RimI-like enzyme
MIRELVWDSEHFGKKIGSLSLTPKTMGRLNRTLKDARAHGFAYLICRLCRQDAQLISALESVGFHLVDIGVTWIGNTGDLLNSLPGRKMRQPSIMEAKESDIPSLRRMATSLFTESRFYNDTFFSAEEADALFKVWIGNSVKKAAADIVFFVPRAGFITCRKSDRQRGEIVLIGLTPKKRGMGIGTQLVKHSLLWFKKQKVPVVSVRTQLKNVGSMNFYRRTGFSIGSYDLVYSKIL